MNSYENTCLRCGQTVYQVDKVGPLKDFTFYHQGCFKCLVCGTKLTLKTYFNNQQSQEDKEVYCQNHVPKTGPGHLDGMSVGIKAALSVPRTNNLVNDQIRGSGKGTFDADALGIKSALTKNHHHQHHEQEYKHAVNRAGRFDASALHITHALNATKVHRGKVAYERNMDEYLRFVGGLCLTAFICVSSLVCVDGAALSRSCDLDQRTPVRKWSPARTVVLRGRKECARWPRVTWEAGRPHSDLGSSNVRVCKVVVAQPVFT
ncbi:hypothetical protein HPB49_020696 [Dermacentor silvarum]|uniref:Uncharacterized protein n=1 Tax=Dermacentor silvarum TaxID=543639 RepID=A0ACB8DKZ2_DERSI|nr:hypothetical protein HPB49_020696 [Dermacentor silvarum]